jgi:hypothetical protein
MKKLLAALGFALIVGTLSAATFPAEKYNFLVKTFVPWEERNRTRLFEVSPQIKIQAEYVKGNAQRWVEISESLEKNGKNDDLKEALGVLNKMYNNSFEMYTKNSKKK